MLYNNIQKKTNDCKFGSFNKTVTSSFLKLADNPSPGN